MALLVLKLWPLVPIILFARLGRERGLIWSVVVGYLFLPENLTIKLDGLPDYHKVVAISLGIALAALLFGWKLTWENVKLTRQKPGRPSAFRGRLRYWRDIRTDFAETWEDHPLHVERNEAVSRTVAVKTSPIFRILVLGLIATLCIAAFMTMRDNQYPLINGVTVRPALTKNDLINMIATTLITLVPFLLAWRWLYTRQHQMEVLKVIVWVGLLYSLLALFELRFSPQLNNIVYGYFPHSWLQHIRNGGYRPIVFLQHGLWLGFFQFTAAMAGFALARQGTAADKITYLLAGLWLLAVLLVSHNLGAALLAIMFVPLVFMTRWLQLRAAMVVAIIFMAYPAVRQAEILPINGFLAQVSKISGDRASSLAFRLENEAMLLERVAEKPVFGWGGWGRWRIFDEKGNDLTVSDGAWIIVLGERGWFGYISFFGMLTLPILFLGRVARQKRLSHSTAGMSMIMAGNLIYMVPNSALSPIGWLMAGALAAAVHWQQEDVEVKAPEKEGTDKEMTAGQLVGRQMAQSERRPQKRYSRFAPGSRPGLTSSRRLD